MLLSSVGIFRERVRWTMKRSVKSRSGLQVAKAKAETMQGTTRGRARGWQPTGEHLAQLKTNLIYCSLAQSVEHAAVNRGVVSSSLTGAAKKAQTPIGVRAFFFVLLASTAESQG